MSSLNSDSSRVGIIIATTLYPEKIKGKKKKNNHVTLLEQEQACCKPRLT